MSAQELAAHTHKVSERRALDKVRRDLLVAERRAANDRLRTKNQAVMAQRFARISSRVRGARSYVYASYSIRADTMSPEEFEFHRRQLTIVPREAAPHTKMKRAADGTMRVDRGKAARDAHARESKTLELHGNNARTKKPDEPLYVRVPPQYGARVWGRAQVNVQSTGAPLSPGLRFSGGLWGPNDPFDQQFVIRLLVEHLKTEKRGGIFELPTSCGKTIIMIWIVVVLLKRRALIVLPMLAIHTQLIMRLEQFVPGIKVGSIQGETYDVAGKDVVVAMVHTLANTPELMQRPEFNDIGIVLFDEVDRFATVSFSAVVTGLAHIYWMFGLTATLERKDDMQRMFELYFGYPIYSAPRSTKQNRLTTVVRLRYDEGERTVLYRETKQQKRDREREEAAGGPSRKRRRAVEDLGGSGPGDDQDEEDAMRAYGDAYGGWGQDEGGGGSGGGYGGYGGGGGGYGDGSGGQGQESAEQGEIDTQAMTKRLTTDERRHAYLLRLLLMLLGRGRRIAVLVTDIAYAKRLLDECQAEFAHKRMVHYAATLTAKQREDIDEEAHDLIVASFQIFSVGIDLAYLDTLVFAMPRRTITQAAGRLRAVARGFERQPLFIYDLVDTFGMFASQARARNDVYRTKRFSLLDPCTVAEYLDEPQFPAIVPLEPEAEAELDEELRLEEEARLEAAMMVRRQFVTDLAKVRRLHPPPPPPPPPTPPRGGG